MNNLIKNSNFVSDLCRLMLLMALTFLASSCSDNCEIENRYTYFEPVYMTMEDLRSSVAVDEPREVTSIGKIYFKGDHLFINELNEGYHVIDNHDPSNPKPVAFIVVPGAFDLSIMGNILYTDSYMDLVAIDISNIQDVQEVGRLENLFGNYNSYGFYADTNLGVVTDWVERSEVTVTESSCEGRMNAWGMHYEGGIALADASSFNANSAVSPANPGIGGSMARFTIANNQLFALDQAEVVPIDITNFTNMHEGSRLFLDWGIETLFPYGTTLFVGANDGMHILNVSDPLNPALISRYDHVRSCDPVVVQDSLAYVTLRSGTDCQGFTNQLEVIDISNLSHPQLLYTYEMHNPHGLGIDHNVLFVCDGSAGLKVFDAVDISVIGERMLAQYEQYFAYDIIPFNNVAMMIGDDGLYQYDYSDLSNIKFLSKITTSDAH